MLGGFFFLEIWSMYKGYYGKILANLNAMFMPSIYFLDIILVSPTFDCGFC